MRWRTVSSHFQSGGVRKSVRTTNLDLKKKTVNEKREITSSFVATKCSSIHSKSSPVCISIDNASPGKAPSSYSFYFVYFLY